jgi:hypothetical protein
VIGIHVARVESIGNDAQRQLKAKLGDEGSAELEEILSLLLYDAKSVVPAKDGERSMTSRSSP